jgi:hypothetical protein
VADAKVEVKALSSEQKNAIELAGNWSANLGQDTKNTALPLIWGKRGKM